MAWNGSGTFSRTNGDHTGSTTWQTDATEGIKIRSDRHDVHDQDLADGINACLAKNGENSMTGDLDLGNNAITNGSVITGTTLEATGDTSAGDNAAVGYTATEGLILTGQGSTNDVTIKNDADATVISIPTGTVNTTFAGNITSDGDIQAEATTDDNGFLGYAGATHIFSLTRETNNLKISSFDDIQFWPSAATLGGGSEIAAVTSDGITFNGDTAAANALDDYEEGTWTPVLSDGTNNATMATQSASYTKVGRKVTFQCNASTSSLGSVSGNIRITGLPFTSDATYGYGPISVGYTSNLSLTAQDTVTGYVEANSTYIHLTTWDATTGISFMQQSEWTANGQLIFSGFYYV